MTVDHLEPEYPREAGIEEAIPDASRIEGAELLANQARPILRSLGFDDREVEAWAWTYITEQGSGDLDSFLGWMRERERRN